MQDGLGKNLMEQMRSSLISQAKSSTPKSGDKDNKAKSSLLGLFKRKNDQNMPKPQDIQSRSNLSEFKQDTPKGSIATAGSNSEEQQIPQPPPAPIAGPSKSKMSPDDTDIAWENK